MSIQLRVYEGIASIPQEAWDQLHTDEDSPFVEWEWLSALENTGCAVASRGWQPLHLTVWRDGLLVAAAPAYVKSHSEGEFVFDFQWAGAAQRMGTSYYPKLVVGVPFTPATGARLLRAPGEPLEEVSRVLGEGAIALAKRAGFSSVHVLFPHEAEAKALTENGYMQRVGVQFHWTNENYGSMDDFLARFQSKKRNALKREMSQPKRDEMRIETMRGEALREEYVRPMFTFYRSTVEKFMWGRQYLTEAFFSRVVRTFSHRLEWVLARDRDGSLVAGAFNAARGKKLYGRYWGCVQEFPFLHFNVCFYEGIAQSISRGLRVFEPGAGGEHKLVRGFEPTLTYSAHWIGEPRLQRLLNDFLQRETVAVQNAVEKEKAEGPLRKKERTEVT